MLPRVHPGTLSIRTATSHGQRLRTGVVQLWASSGKIDLSHAAAAMYLSLIPLFLSFQRMYYHGPSGQRFELYKRGPCAEGHILSYNYGQLRPQCKCKDHYHLHVDGKCYSLNTEGKAKISQLHGNYVKPHFNAPGNLK